MVKSAFVVGNKTGDSGMVMEYQVDEFTHTRSSECFIALSHIYPGFMDKVLLLTHFLLEPGCEDFSFLDQAVEEHEHGLDFILIDSNNAPDLNASFDRADAMSSSVSPRFLCFCCTISDNSRLAACS